MALDIWICEILYQERKRSQNVKNWEQSNINLQNAGAYKPLGELHLL